MLFLLPQIIGRSAERAPGEEAVRYASQSMTYEELVAQSNSLARILLEIGVARGERVGIFMEKGLKSAVAIYGIMKAGAAYVPLDPFAPTSRLNYVIRDCGIRFLVTNEAKSRELQQVLAEENSLSGIVGVPEGELPLPSVPWDHVNSVPSGELPSSGLTEQDLAYILYTSGSTGDPKGIMHTHRSALTFAEWAAAAYKLQSDDRLSNHAPLHFDLSTFDFFAGGLAGATTVIIPEALTKFPVNLSKMIQEERISVWYSVPFALIQLLLRGTMDRFDMRSLRWVLFAGEPFPTKHLRALMAELPHARFSNLYGPTETNVCTYYHVSPLPEDSDAPIPIGKACDNAEALVVDEDDQPLPAGEVGELLIRSPLVMRGYWNLPEMTERGLFRRKAFSGYEDVFYRTGDLVELQADGNFKYLGRKDRQIKTRGYRVELNEIEVVLLSYDHVEEAAAYPVPDGEGSNLIEAAVTVKADANADVEKSALIEHVARQLPAYAIPVRIKIVDSFPRTSTGKINRRALVE